VISKRDLLHQEEKAWRELSTRFNLIAPEDWKRKGASGDWTPKDVLAHIASWHSLAVEEMEIRRNGQKPVRAWATIDEANEEFREKCKSMSVHDVQVMSGTSRQRFREEVEKTPEPLHAKAEEFIIANAHGHYEEHIAGLDAFLESR